ncbi:MAG: hypothetical protein V3R87_00165 [Dehalococcoidia bacterium]
MAEPGPLYIDFPPDVSQHPASAAFERQVIAAQLTYEFESRLPFYVEARASLPSLIVTEGPYRPLLKEARTLYTFGYYYSCVAMCGITAERIVKDIFVTNIRVMKSGKPGKPSREAEEVLESFGAKQICDFLLASGLLHKNLNKPLKDLAVLRNKYTHARQSAKDEEAARAELEKDARKAIKLLHTTVEGTVAAVKGITDPTYQHPPGPYPEDAA